MSSLFGAATASPRPGRILPHAVLKRLVPPSQSSLLFSLCHTPTPPAFPSSPLTPGKINAHFVGTTAPGEGGEPPKRVLVDLSAKGQDPGYKGTALMATEAALCMALDTDKLFRARTRPAADTPTRTCLL